MNTPLRALPGPIVIVGGGGAAAMAVSTLVRGGRSDVVVITDEDALPYDRTMLSKSVLAGEVDTAKPFQADHMMQVDVRRGIRVTSIDRAAQVIDVEGGEALGYGTLLLATGARPRSIPLPGLDLVGAVDLRSAADAARLITAVDAARQVVVVGGGLIGLEAAAALRKRGLDVTVVEVADRLMGRVLPPMIADAIADAHVDHGVVLEIGVRPARVVGDEQGRVAAVELDDGRSLQAQAVLVAVGVAPCTELAEAAGLTVDDGILVDEHLMTSDEHILAAGDAVRVAGPDGAPRPRTESWTPALAMGQHAAMTMLGDASAYAEVPWMWSDQYDLQVQAAGVAVNGLIQVERGALDEPNGHVVFGLDDAGRVLGAAGISRGTKVGRSIRGAQKLIESGARVDPVALADPTVEVRSLVPRG